MINLSTPSNPLLQVLQDASKSVVVHVPAEIHQLGVDVCGHTAVGGGGEVGAGGHHAGTARRGAFGTPLHQGTKSENKSPKVILNQKQIKCIIAVP